ncbi:MAG: ScyD/ScyE family protein [Chloroflexota bacterium]|nr:ScyD/ScyE family protein [Chloroflexota bacterium]
MPSFDARLSRRQVAKLGAAATAVVATARTRSAFAQDATPAGDEGGMPGLPPLPEGATVVAEGLWNPTNMAFGEDGTLYIAESGVSGGGAPDSEPATPLADGSLPPAPPALVAGQITAVAPDGTVSVLAEGLGSVAGIDAVGGTLYISAGGGSVAAGFQPNPVENIISTVDIATGAVTPLVELGSYEVENNPDGTDVNPNLYGLVVTEDGTLYVADAGGNTIYSVDTATGDFSLFAVVPNLDEITGGTPTAESRQTVPTAVVVSPEGELQVSLLSEVWTGPSLLTFSEDGSWTAENVTFSFATNIAYGPDGLLYVAQLIDDGTNQESPGSVRRVTADGTLEPVVEGLFFPHGIAFDADGNLYVTIASIISGPDAPMGQVIRIDGVAATA